MRIVGFEVEPRSYWPKESVTLEYTQHKPLYIDELKSGETTFAFTYSINSVIDNESTWSTRFDHYLKTGNEQVHWAAICLSLIIITLLSCILATSVKRSVNKDMLGAIKEGI